MTVFVILSVYIRKLVPCLMVAAVIREKIPVRYLVLALRKWRFPESLIIALSITLRYFPAIREERIRIREALRLREIKGFRKPGSFMVPMMIIHNRSCLAWARVTAQPNR